tara:strand:- start:474 stop:1214 length:741 start_codon:yes stop_codon:yes gene_type:complete
MDKLKLLDLFSGIGGFSLGLERTGGFETVAFCEIEPFPKKVLAKHWPEVPQYEDIRNLTAARLRADGIAVDAISAGWPCQDISQNGGGAGLAGDRSGLWFEALRLISELRPQIVFLENVTELLDNGMGEVLGSLSEIRYDAEWHAIPLSYAGTCHIRDRVWILAHPAEKPGLYQSNAPERAQRLRDDRIAWPACPWDAPEACVRSVEDGLPNDVARFEALGNGLGPQIPELLGNAYLESIGWRDAH